MKWIPIGTRRYGAHVPRKLPKNPALVVAIHSGALTPEAFEAMTGWSTLATRQKFIVVYPEGLKGSWNAGNSALGFAGRTGVDDVGFIHAVISDAAAHWKFARVHLSGHSNGSMLAHWYASFYPGFTAAIGCVSGGFSLLPAHSIAAGCASAVRMVHGTNDTHVPFAGGVGPDALDPYNHLPIEMTASWWRGQGAELVTLWHAGGHEWPNGEAQAQWEFFRGIG